MVSEKLTQNEFNIAYPIAMGKSLKESAALNSVLRSTALSRLRSIYLKLDVHSWFELALAFEKEEF